ncbi:MAG: endonuclease MutS2 [Candidatus Mcinerneyibacterium aminivorans]|uniref:Endonuclease MutS2 n=1 Tax=Candidatus Mcinerneyibacterium aminivorans TaxID=2703815 RepID=A0A5D0MG80_9BACT|nr:MAG: endonuclease MutS2 [Candidatus Mcinerneyibacterium aminivorans]
MILNKSKLEFDAIKSRLKSMVLTDQAKEIIENQKFSSDVETAKKRLDKNYLFRKLFLTNHEFYLKDIFDMEDFISDIEKDIYYQLPGNYKKLERMLTEAIRVKKLFSKLDEEFKLIKNYSNELSKHSKLIDFICSKINDEEEIREDASELLKGLINEEKSLRKKLQSSINKLMKKYNKKGYLQDKLYTSRNDRFVLPVKARHSGKIKGIVQGTSASGNTMYMEPMEIVELNNNISSIYHRIEEEKKKILYEIGEKVNNKIYEIKKTLKCLYKLDFEIAKAKYVDSIDAEKPEINKNGNFEIYKGRHPLIDEEEVVPIDIWLKNDKKGIVITGPNAGGKTVTLKTIGLFTLMTMFGLMIPAKEWSKISIFDNIFVDIGDYQSIEQNLSTFSGHINNFTKFVNTVDKNTLILLDEIGVGTDPEEGASLAMALIDYFIDEGATVIVTTHYNALKRHSMEDDRLENASCLFDYENIEPLYKIKVGTPGSSSGLLVAKKLGLPEIIINKAESYIDKEHLKLEEMITELEHKLSKTEDLKENLEKENEKLQEKMEYYENELEKITNKKTRKKMESLQDFEREFFNIKDQLNDVLNKMQQKENEKEEVDEREVKKKVDEAIKKVKNEKEKIKQKMKKIEKPEVGDKIYLEGYKIKGTVEEIDKRKDNVKLNCNGMIVNVSMDDLIGYKVEEDEKSMKERKTNYSVDKTSKFVGTEIVLVGMRRLDAIEKLGDFISHAILEGHENIKIVHGIGTGVLREAIHDYLEENPNIKDYYYEDRRGVVTIGEL